jgi:hypothetical protein
VGAAYADGPFDAQRGVLRYIGPRAGDLDVLRANGWSAWYGGWTTIGASQNRRHCLCRRE